MLFVIEATPLAPYLPEGMVGSCGDVVTDPADARKFNTAADAALAAEWLAKGTAPWTRKGVPHYELAARKLLDEAIQYELPHPLDIAKLFDRDVHSNGKATRPARKRRR